MLLYTIDHNNVITRNSDGKHIVRDITAKEYQDFLYVQQYNTIAHLDVPAAKLAPAAASGAGRPVPPVFTNPAHRKAATPQVAAPLAASAPAYPKPAAYVPKPPVFTKPVPVK